MSDANPLRETVVCMWCRRTMTAGELLFHDMCPDEPLSDWDRRQLALGLGDRAVAMAAAAAAAARDAASAEMYANKRGLLTHEDKMAYVSASGWRRGRARGPRASNSGRGRGAASNSGRGRGAARATRGAGRSGESGAHGVVRPSRPGGPASRRAHTQSARLAPSATCRNALPTRR